MKSGEKMPQTRLENLLSRLDAYKKAELAILDGAQSYQIGSRRLDRAQLGEVTEMITYLEREVAAEQRRAAGRGSIRVIGVIPRDI